MTATPLLDRIAARRPQPEPTPIEGRMSPFMRRIAEKRLAVKDFTNGSWTPAGSDVGA